MEAAAVVNEFIEAFNEADWKRFSATCSPEVVYEEKGSNRTVRGADAVLELAKGWRAAFPDVRGKIYNVTAAGTTAAWRSPGWAPTPARSNSPTEHFPPPASTWSSTACRCSSFEGGKVTQMRHYLDLLTMLTQVGAIPS